MEACEAQFERAFHANHLNATEVDNYFDGQSVHYLFYFSLPRNVRVQLDWRLDFKAMVLQKTTYELGGQGIFQYIEWEKL